MLSPREQSRQVSSARGRVELAERLRARGPEMEELLLLRANAVSDSSTSSSLEYQLGLRKAVAAAVQYGLATVECGAQRCGPIPAALPAQAGLAARSGVGLETVLRRYLAGYTAVGDFLMQEAHREAAGTSHRTLCTVQRELASSFDRLIAAASAEYERQAQDLIKPSEERRASQVRHLLAGELIDTAELAYEFDDWHLGAVGSGTGAAQRIREFAGLIDCRLLLIPSREHGTWAWFGARRKLDPADLPAFPTATRSDPTMVAFGAPAQGLRGWRLTHRQARAAQAIALRDPKPLTIYQDVALLASLLADEVLAGYLENTYLVPFCADPDGGTRVRSTMRAYFAASRNLSSAAASLGVARQTVATRLRAIEERLGRPIDVCGGEFELALKLAEIKQLKPLD